MATSFPVETYRGPTNDSNWLIPGRVMVGGFPREDGETAAIVQAGVNGFVTLQPEKELQRLIPRSAARAMNDPEDVERLIKDYAIPYRPAARQAAQALGRDADELLFLNFGIPDGDVRPNEDVARFVTELEELLRREPGRVLYIHCMAGRGRTGTVAAVLLSRLEGLTGPQALQKVGALLRTRVFNFGSSPENSLQIQQVLELCPQ